MPTLTGRFATYTANNWTAFTNVWNPQTLVYDRDYRQTVTVDSVVPHSGFVAAWEFPARQGNAIDVHSYPSLRYGASPWNVQIGASDGLPIKVADISSMILNYSTSMSGDTTGYDIAFDIWLTDTPGGDSSHITHEIMIWIHSGAFLPAGSKVGAFSDGLFTSSIYTRANMVDAAGVSNHKWTYVAFQSAGDDLSGQIDFAAMLRTLKTMGVVTGNEYLANVELGAEVAYGTGSLTINHVGVNINGAGNYIGPSDKIYHGTVANDDIYLYGNSSSNLAGFSGTAHDATYKTKITFTLNATILGPTMPSVHVYADGKDLGVFKLHAVKGTYVDSFGVQWSAPETFTVSVPGLTRINELKVVYEGPVDVGGPERVTAYFLSASVGDTPLTSATYHASNGALEQQRVGSTVAQHNGGYTIFDVTPWNSQVAARTLGSASNPIVVDGAGGSDTLHVLGLQSQYSITANADGSFTLREQANLGQNAILKGVSTVVFQDGSSMTVKATGSGAATSAGDLLTGAPTGGSTLDGLAGDDTIAGSGPGSNYLRGGDGADFIIGGTAFDDINGNMGNDTASGGLGEDWVVGGKDNDSLSGGAAYDLVYGNLGNDTCEGGDGNDVIRGGQDNDVVRGGAGDDYVSGDRGADTMTGDAGADIFHSFGEAGIDRVTDFSLAQGDRVQLDPGTQYTLAQVGADTVINMTGGAQMTLVGVSLDSLTPGWIFGA